MPPLRTHSVSKGDSRKPWEEPAHGLHRRKSLGETAAGCCQGRLEGHPSVLPGHSTVWLSRILDAQNDSSWWGLCGKIKRLEELDGMRASVGGSY